MDKKLNIYDKRVQLYEFCHKSANMEIYNLSDKFLNEYSDEYVNKIYDRIFLNEFVGILIVAIIGLISKHYKKIKNKTKRLEQHCSHMIGEDKKKCLKHIKRRMYEEHVTYIKKLYPMCKKTKDPEKCANILKQKINIYKNKIKL